MKKTISCLAVMASVGTAHAVYAANAADKVTPNVVERKIASVEGATVIGCQGDDVKMPDGSTCIPVSAPQTKTSGAPFFSSYTYCEKGDAVIVSTKGIYRSCSTAVPL